MTRTQTRRAADRASCGLDIANPTDLDAAISETSENFYDFVVVPLIHPRYHTESDPDKPASQRNAPLTRADVVLSSNDWGSYVVGKLDTDVNVDSPVASIRKRGEERLAQELKYSTHLGLPAIMVKLTGENQVNLARIISNAVSKEHGPKIWCQVPLCAPDCSIYEKSPNTIAAPSSSSSSWHWWNKFRLLANQNTKLFVCLEFASEAVPSDLEVKRWLGEPIKTVILPTSIFLTNKKGYPVLSKAHQTILKQILKLDIQFILKGPTRHGQLSFYQQYLSHLYTQIDSNDPLCNFAKGFEDFLQIPLQPLMDNLESSTYEVFERDPVKYSQYLVAMQRAITDMIPEDEIETKVLTVMVVGAGRGPLVKAAISAAANAGRKIKVFAVEKNVNAVVTLQHLKLEQWGDQVTVVSSDMRDWNPPKEDYADILVSELLGSFGDNELSPECLDGAQKFLKPTGVSIPTSYTSYIGPIMSSKLYNEYRNSKDESKHPMAAFETPYVVHLLNVTVLAEPKPIFSFFHPNREKIIDNSRYKAVDFVINSDCVMHGFGGYFECNLYKDTMISILPSTHSPGMFSWFPIMFPIVKPLQLSKGERLSAHFWRCVSKHHVWYEWCVSDPTSTPIHNPNGRSYQIGL